MAATKLADVIVPEVWNDYFQEKSAEKNALLNSGIAYTDSQIQNLANGGGQFVHLPFFTDLDGDEEAGGKGYDGDPLTMDKIGTAEDVAVKIFRAKMWGATDFSGILSGADPMGAIADRVIAFWERKRQKAMIATLSGIFGGALASTHVLDISGNTGDAAVIDPSSTIDAGALLGDQADNLAAIAMHSATYAKLQKDNVIEFVEPSDAKVRIPTYLGKRVIVDDGMPVDTANGVYTTYLFASGALAYARITKDVTTVETDRDTAGGVDTLTSREAWILHPRGVKWKVTTANPGNADLATAGNWERVYEPKNIRIVALKHKIA